MTQQITALPTPPTRTDPNNFATRADAFLAALPTMASEANQLITETNQHANICAGAAQGVGTLAWVSGTTYAVGDVRYDTTNFLTYRRKTAGAGTTRPGLDSTNWQLLSGLGDVDSVSTQTIGGAKTFTGECSFDNTGPFSIGSTQLVKDDNGNFGIGTTPSAWSSGVKALQFNNYGSLSQISGQNIFQVSQNAYYDGAWKYISAAPAAQYQLDGSNHFWKVAPTGSAGGAIAWTTGLALLSDGRIYGAALHNNAGSVSGTVNQYIASGTYTPTRSVASPDESDLPTLYACQWIRVGNVVTVSGRVGYAAGSTFTSFGLSLPIASTFASAQSCAGTAVGFRSGSSTSYAARISGVASGNYALFEYTPPGALLGVTFSFTFTYLIA